MRSLRRTHLHHGLILLAALLFLTACGEKFDTRTTYALGTLVSITVPSSADDAAGGVVQLFTEKQRQVDAWEAAVNDAPVGKAVPVEPGFIHLLETAKYLRNLTGNRFDITVFALTRAYGFPEGPFREITEEERTDIAPMVDFTRLAYTRTHVVKKAPVAVHTGAFAKGWIVDEAVRYLKAHGVEHALINAGGDIRALGNKSGRPWRIAIRHPDTNERYLGVIRLDNRSLATSGDYERFFETDDGRRITHIFDAKTLAPADNWKSVSVVADTCEKADGLATAYWLMSAASIETVCAEEHTPVLAMAKDGTVMRFCGWESLEE